MPYTSPLPPLASLAAGTHSIVELVIDPLFDDPAAASLPAITEVETGRTITYAELARGTYTAAENLRNIGISAGDTVALSLENGIDFALTLLGISALGATACLINPMLQAQERENLIALANATHLLTAAPSAHGGGHTPIRGEHNHNRGDNDAESDPALDAALDAALDVAIVAFSSGTTGLPKAVELPHSAICANIQQFTAALGASGVSRGTRTLAPLPFSHIYGLNTLLLSSLYARHHVHTMARFNLDSFISAHRNHNIELTFIAPPIALALATYPAVDPTAFTDCRYMVCGAASLDEQLARRAEERVGMVILQGFGTTESAPVTHVGIAGKSRPGSIGFAVPNTQFRIVKLGANGHACDVAEGEAGELLIRGPQVMRGYRNDEAATQAAFCEGWLRTGDVARLAEDGSVYIVDRVKEIINYRGYQVAPAELEAILLQHPGIADAAVTGYQRSRGGFAEEVPRAFVVKQNNDAGAKLTGDDVCAWVAERVAKYKKVREVTFTDRIPKSAAGKILRKDLRGLPL